MQRPEDQGHYHLSVHAISRLKGHCVQAAAAYRRAELFEGTSVAHAAAYQRAQELGNDGQVFDYRRKLGVAWTGIMAPTFTPKELLDPQTLWNTVDRIESRKNARLAREMIVALPHQVDLEVHVAMLRSFVTANLVCRGLIADVAIHRPPVEHEGDPRNWHAHVLLTDRPMTADGFAAKKDRLLNAKAELLAWRKAWADVHNATMAHLGINVRIDHRSLEAQRANALACGDQVLAWDLDRTPQIHVGKATHATHPDYTAFKARRTRNDDILAHNRSKARTRADVLASLIAKADSAAYLEARINAIKVDLAQPESVPLSLDELQARYGRKPSPLTPYLQKDIDKAAAGVVIEAGWTTRPSEASLLDVLAFLRLESNLEAHKKPAWFAVTARDLAFTFYGWGIIDKASLQRSLEHDTAARTRHNPRAPQPPPIPKRLPPPPPTPKAYRLARLRSVQPATGAIALRRLMQLTAFRDRHQANRHARRQRLAWSQAQLTTRRARTLAAVGHLAPELAPPPATET